MVLYQPYYSRDLTEVAAMAAISPKSRAHSCSLPRAVTSIIVVCRLFSDIILIVILIFFFLEVLGLRYNAALAV